MVDDEPGPAAGGGRRHFATTQWSVVIAAGDADCDDARSALAQLCETYWFPLYAYIRRRGYAESDAQDLTQAFFARLLEKQSLGAADRRRGRFRAFLIASLDHFLANERDRARAKKRGGAGRLLSLDLAAGESRMGLEPAHHLTAERLYQRQWALTLLDVVLNRLRAEYEASGKGKLYELVSPALAGGSEKLPFAEIAKELETTPENARQAAHRLRKRYRTLLRQEVARTVAEPAEVDEELAELFQALGN